VLSAIVVKRIFDSDRKEGLDILDRQFK